MKISPIASANAVQPTTTNNTDARAKAIAAFTNQGAAPTTPVQAAQSEVVDESTQEPIQESQVIEHTEPEAVEESPEKIAASRRYAQLALQEKQLRQRAAKQEQDFKQRMAELDAKEAQYKQAQAPSVDMSKYIERDRLQNDAWSVLSEAGLTYEQIAQQMMNDTPTDPRVSREMQALKQQLADMKAEKEQEKKQQAESQTQQYQAAVKQIENEARHLVQNDPAFEAIKHTNSVKDVVELITQTYDKDGVLLTVEEAAEQVENYLVEQAIKFTSIGKIKQRLGAQSAQKPPVTAQKTAAATPQPPAKSQPQMKTLTNTTAVTRQLSARERALLAFKGELK